MRRLVGPRHNTRSVKIAANLDGQIDPQIRGNHTANRFIPGKNAARPARMLWVRRQLHHGQRQTLLSQRRHRDLERLLADAKPEFEVIPKIGTYIAQEETGILLWGSIQRFECMNRVANYPEHLGLLWILSGL